MPALILGLARCGSGSARREPSRIPPSTRGALTAHLVFPGGHPGDEFLAVAASELRQRFGIGHTTLQIEISEQTACHLAPDHVV